VFMPKLTTKEFCHGGSIDTIEKPFSSGNQPYK